MKPDQALPPTGLSSDDAAELARLREFVAVYRQLVRKHDSSLPRWRRYQTEWLWLYLRGMVSGETPLSVKQRRLDELEVDKVQSEERSELTRDIKSAKNRVVKYAKIEMFGGPADGQVRFVCLPIPEARTAHSPSSNGDVVRSLYRRPAGEIGDIVAFKVQSLEATASDAELERAFSGKRSTRFYHSPN